MRANKTRRQHRVSPMCRHGTTFTKESALDVWEFASVVSRFERSPGLWGAMFVYAVVCEGCVVEGAPGGGSNKTPSGGVWSPSLHTPGEEGGAPPRQAEAFTLPSLPRALFLISLSLPHLSLSLNSLSLFLCA